MSHWIVSGPARIVSSVDMNKNLIQLVDLQLRRPGHSKWWYIVPSGHKSHPRRVAWHPGPSRRSRPKDTPELQPTAGKWGWKHDTRRCWFDNHWGDPYSWISSWAAAHGLRWVLNFDNPLYCGLVTKSTTQQIWFITYWTCCSFAILWWTQDCSCLLGALSLIAIGEATNVFDV